MGKRQRFAPEPIHFHFTGTSQAPVDRTHQPELELGGPVLTIRQRAALPLSVGVTVEARLPGRTVCLTRTTPDTWRVVALDGFANLLDPAYARNFTDERTARQVARDWTAALKAEQFGAYVETVITNDAAYAA